MTPPRDSSATDRRELHFEKMRNKAARRAKFYRDTVDDKRRPVGRNSAIANRKLAPLRFGSIAIFNRHTGQPHTDAREIARRQRSA